MHRRKLCGISLSLITPHKDTGCFVFISGISLSLIPLHKDTNCFVLFLVFRYRSYQFKKLGTMIVPFYKQAQTFSQREVCSCL